MRTIFLIILLGPALLKGQDIHFSQFFHNPVFQNPAMSGQFDGSWRFAGNQRLQWRSVTNNPYNTIALSADANGLLHENLGLGAMVFHDVAGDSKFRTIQLAFNGNWKFQLNESHALRTGIQMGLVHRSINYNDLYFGAQYNGIYYDPGLSNQENFQREARLYPDLATGISYHYHNGERLEADGGIGVYNLLAPKQSWFNDADILLDRRISIFAQAQLPLSEKIDALPATQLMLQGTYREWLIGCGGRYILKQERSHFRAVKAGIYYRNRDAGYAMIGMDYDNWTAGISYDINLSNLVPASRYRGGFEIALIYIIRKMPPIPRIPYCPGFI